MMIAFWKRTEVYFGISRDRYHEICGILESNHIRCKQTTHGYPCGGLGRRWDSHVNRADK